MTDMRILLVRLVVVLSCCILTSEADAADANSVLSTISTKWSLNLKKGCVELALRNNGSQPVQIYPKAAFFSDTKMAPLDLRYTYGAWTFNANNSVIYPVVIFNVNPTNINVAYNVSDSGGRVWDPISIAAGEEKVISYSWKQGFNDFASISTGMSFYFVSNGKVISSAYAKHGQGDALDFEAIRGNH